MDDQQPETAGNGNGAEAEGGEYAFSLDKIYVKDMSLEVPDAPEVFAEDQAKTKVDMNLKNSHRRLDGDNIEVVLHVTMRATVEDRMLFLVEIDQAGLFLIRGYTDEQLRQLVSATCPATLYPYLREAISATIGRAGFPSMLLQPINFDALYARGEAERTKEDA